MEPEPPPVSAYSRACCNFDSSNPASAGEALAQRSPGNSPATALIANTLISAARDTVLIWREHGRRHKPNLINASDVVTQSDAFLQLFDLAETGELLIGDREAADVIHASNLQASRVGDDQTREPL